MNEERNITPQRIFTEMERRDEEQILAELQGKILDEFFYEVKGKKGVSYAGINEICYRMKHIHVDPWVKWEQNDKYWFATVRAVNTVEDISALGTSQQPKMMMVYDRDERRQRIPDGEGGFKSHLEEDGFARVKALSKSQRNAKKAVIPIETLKVMVEEWSKLVKQGKQGGAPPRKKVESEQEAMIKEQARRDRDERLARERGARLHEEPEVRETASAPKSLDEMDYRLRGHIPGLDELLTLGERDDHFRVFKKRRLEDDEFEMVNAWIRQMGGSWAQEENCWRIPKEG